MQAGFGVHAAGREVTNATSTASEIQRSLLPRLLGASARPTH